MQQQLKHNNVLSLSLLQSLLHYIHVATTCVKIKYANLEKDLPQNSLFIRGLRSSTSDTFIASTSHF
jgi:hypothetical protein